MTIDTGFITLIVGLLGVLVLTAIIGLVLWMRRTRRVRIAAGALSTVIVTLGPEERQVFASRMREAVAAHEGTPAPAPKLPDAIRLGRVLWVDDETDTSLTETLALQCLGIAVMKATHADAALAYLSADPYAALVFGISPDSDLDAIAAFVARVRAQQPGIEIFAYAPPGMPSGARDVTLVHEPGELVSAILMTLRVGT